MTPETKKKIIATASEYANTEEGFDLFLAEEGWQDWMNDYTDAAEDEECTEAEIAEIEKIQRELFDEAHAFPNVLRMLRAENNLTQAAFASRYGIPKRSVENWESGVSTPPEYVQNLIIAALRKDT